MVTETDSCTAALALLIAIYNVFEIRFTHHSRSCKLLYAILFEDSHYLNKPLKSLLNNWQYRIIHRPSIKRQGLIMNVNETSNDLPAVDERSSDSSAVDEKVASTSRFSNLVYSKAERNSSKRDFSQKVLLVSQF